MSRQGGGRGIRKGRNSHCSTHGNRHTDVRMLVGIHSLYELNLVPRIHWLKSKHTCDFCYLCGDWLLDRKCVFTYGTVLYRAARMVFKVDGSFRRAKTTRRTSVTWLVKSITRDHTTTRFIHVIVWAHFFRGFALVNPATHAIVESNWGTSGAVTSAHTLTSVADESLVIITSVFTVTIEKLLILFTFLWNNNITHNVKIQPMCFSRLWAYFWGSNHVSHRSHREGVLGILEDRSMHCSSLDSLRMGVHKSADSHNRNKSILATRIPPL